MNQVTSVKSLILQGINVVQVEVQVQVTPGVPAFTIVGLADKTIAESKERVRGALTSIGLCLPSKKILVNLAPANLVKEGSHFDLAIASAILEHLETVPKESFSNYLISGELGLHGEILPVPGILPATMHAGSLGKGIICPAKNGAEAARSGNENILPADHLLSLINHFRGISTIAHPVTFSEQDTVTHHTDIADIKGHKMAKRAVEVAAAGGHNLLMFGPPGSGKSMLASCIPGILSEMTKEEILECSMIYSVAGLIKDGSLTSVRPFRAPHQSASIASIVGGGIGNKVKPGEISLAHNGVLFLDELPEFNTAAIDALRQPLETGEVLITRSNWHVQYPANFQLVAAMNPCKCGYLGVPGKECSKVPECGRKYISKISGPILDRFSMQIEVSDYSAYLDGERGEDSHTVMQRVKHARDQQKLRYEKMPFTTNARASGKIFEEHTELSQEGNSLLRSSMQKFQLSMRAHSTILKVARTIADLDLSEKILPQHISEAVNYRCTDTIAAKSDEQQKG